MSLIRSASCLTALLFSFVLPSCSTLYRVNDRPLALGVERNVTFLRPEVVLHDGREVAGLTTPLTQTEYVIKVRSGLVSDKARRVTAHELMHAAGLRTHEVRKDCYIYGSALAIAPGHLCPSERARLRRAQGTIVVEVAPDNREIVSWAIGFLNAEVGRIMYVLAGE